MTDSLGDLLKRRPSGEPPEVTAIKKFLQDEFQSTGTITVRDTQIIIAVSSAALAGTLRMHLPELKKLAQTNKRLVIRIG